MQFVKWLDIYNLDVPVLDTQHKHLIYLLNDTYRVFFMKDNYEDIIGEVLDNFIKFYSEHFQTEEKFLEIIDFPTINYHKLLHKKILDMMYKYKKEYIEKEGINLEEFLNVLNDWVFEHLTIEDMTIKEHLYYIDNDVLENYKLKLEDLV